MIKKGTEGDTYNIESFIWVKEARFHRSFFSVDNLGFDDAVRFLEGRMLDPKDAPWALDIARLTFRTTYVNDKGELNIFTNEVIHEMGFNIPRYHQ